MDIRIKEWEKLKYIDPAAALPKLREIQLEVNHSNLNQKVKDLRTNLLKKYLELRAAAIFCYGFSIIFNKKLFLAAASTQDRDYDIVIRNIERDSLIYTAAQIKEVVPATIDRNADLNVTIENLLKYTDSRETVVIIHDNREGIFNVKDVKIPTGLNIGGLWTMGTTVKDQSEWFIAGDFLKEGDIYKFTYPTL